MRWNSAPRINGWRLEAVQVDLVVADRITNTELGQAGLKFEHSGDWIGMRYNPNCHCINGIMVLGKK